MKASKKANKHIFDDLGGAFPNATKLSTSASDATTEQDSDEFDLLYSRAIEPAPAKHHDAHSEKNRLKAKRLAEARLVRLSDELSQLANEIRYLNPLMAETLDEAWEATEDAIEMLSNEHLW